MKKYLIALSVILIAIISCRKNTNKEFDPPSAKPLDSLGLDAVKNWYNAHLNAATNTNNLQTAGVKKNVFSLKTLSFDWNKATNVKDKLRNWWIVALPGQPTYRGFKQGYRKLAFVRDSTGALEAHILEIIPDAAYLHQHKKADTKTFTGLVFVYGEHYQLLYGRIYNGGHRVGTIRPGSPGQSSNPASTVQTNTTNKIKVDLVAFDEDCEWVDDNYIDSEGEAAIYGYNICTTTIYDDSFYPDGGGGGGGVPAGDPLGGGGGGGGDEATAPAVIPDLPDQPKTPIDPKAYINCFGGLADDGAKETVTVCVQEPQPGLPFNYGANSVGHTAISLSKTNNGQTITQTVGFYPTDSKLAVSGVSSKLVDNTNLNYTVSITYSVLPYEFNAIAAYISNPPTTYNLYTSNCTNFVYNACQQGNISLPNPTGNVGMFQTGMTPGALGSSIRNVAPDMNVNSKGGVVGQSHGPCN